MIDRSFRSPNGQKMRAGADQTRFMFDLSQHSQQALTLAGIVPQAFEIPRQPARPFNREYVDQIKSAFAKLGSQFVRTVKNRIREIQQVARRIAMLALSQTAIQDRGKLRLVEESAGKRIQ